MQNSHWDKRMTDRLRWYLAIQNFITYTIEIVLHNIYIVHAHACARVQRTHIIKGRSEKR